MTWNRRQFLRGIGGALALPFLPSLAPRRAWADALPAPKRFLAFYVPNGIQSSGWTPERTGAGFDLKPILLPLEAHQNRIRVISGLRNDPARPDGPGDHAAGTGSFLTAAHCYKTEGAGIRNGISIDQVIANQIGNEHRFRSLALASEGGGNAGGCDSGYSCAYSRNISWVSETTPAPREARPSVLFTRLFGSAAAQITAEERALNRSLKRSILDYVHADAQAIQPRLARADQRKLDQYLTAVREVERQLDLGANQQCDPGTIPGYGADVPTHVHQMIDLMVLAFQCDLTPVITYMLGNAGSNRPMPHLGIADGHHTISHHQNNPEAISKLERIAAWELEQVAYLVRRLATTQDTTGTLLDQTVLFFSSEVEDGNRHRHSNLPVLLAGGEGHGLRQGLHERVDDSTPIANLFMGIAAQLGINLNQFGDSNGTLNLG
jgi:hypothetical protein